MPLKLRQVFKWIGAGKMTGINQAHEHIADICPMQCFIEQGVFPMTNDSLKGLFTNVMPIAELCRVIASGLTMLVF
jgi:hypothetical protein